MCIVYTYVETHIHICICVYVMLHSLARIHNLGATDRKVGVINFFLFYVFFFPGIGTTGELGCAHVSYVDVNLSIHIYMKIYMK